MKVLIINAESGCGGGPAIIANSICKEVICSGGESAVAYGRQADSNSGLELIKIGNKISLYTHVLITRLFDMHGLGSTLATKRLIKAVENYKPDVINLHNIHGYYLNYRLLFKYIKERKLPIVWTFHDCWAYTGHCAYYDKIGCDKWKTECINCPQKGDYPRSWWRDRTQKNYHQKKELFTSIDSLTVVCPSYWLAEEVKSSFLSRYPIRVIHNGVDLSKYYPVHSEWKKEHGMTQKKIVLGVAAGWSERKGLSTFIRLSEMLDSTYQIVLVGLTQQQKEELPSRIIRIERTESVNQLIELYSVADVFVNASIEDNFPTVILEALACGTPVVTYDTGGSKESLNDEVGVVVPQGDIQGLINGIVKMSSGIDVEQKCLSRAADFDNKKKYAEYLELFKEIVGKER